MKPGDVLKPKKGSTEKCTIVNAPTPPKNKKWLVQYESGKHALKTTSFLKKYYEVVE